MSRMLTILAAVVLIIGVIGAGIVLFTGANDPVPQVTVQSSDTSEQPETNELLLPDPQPEATRTIYALGDSLTAGYQLPLEESYPSQLQNLLQADGYKYITVNGGRSGDTSAQLLSRLDRLLEDAQAGDLAIIVIGANDGFQSLPLSQLEANIEKMIAILEEKEVKVILGGMQIPTNLSPEYRSEFAAIFPRLGQENDLTLIPFFLENVAAVRELNLPDGIHPTAEGYAIIAEQTKEFLEKNQLITK